jgi:hypothetical protein
MRAIRDLGTVFATTTFHAGRWGLRMAFCNWRTTDRDVELIFESLVEALKFDEPPLRAASND